MISLLVDVNLDGHAYLLQQQLDDAAWNEFKELVEVQFLTFNEVGLKRNATDEAVWQLCQRDGYWLLTSNRNNDADDSLEAVIRRDGTLTTIPVHTISNAKRIYQSSIYLDSVIRRLLEILIYADHYLGTGRLYLP